MHIDVKEKSLQEVLGHSMQIDLLTSQLVVPDRMAVDCKIKAALASLPLALQRQEARILSTERQIDRLQKLLDALLAHTMGHSPINTQQ